MLYASCVLLPPPCQSTFTFAAPKKTTNEIAILNVSGGIMGDMSDDARRKLFTLLDANRQALVYAVFNELRIPSDMWGDAIETRGLIVVGSEKPWTVTIGTIKDDGVMKAVFGADQKTTVTLQVTVKAMVDVKKKLYEPKPVEVEVGVAGMWKSFKGIGGKGRYVLEPGAANGILVDMVLDQNVRTYDYLDASPRGWQEAAAHFSLAHLRESLAAGLSSSDATRLNLEVYAVSPIVPLSTQMYVQAAKGLVVSIVAKGVQWDDDDEADGFGLIKAKPIPLTGNLLTGEVSSDGLTPLVGPVPFRLKVKGIKGASKVQQGTWLAPILVTEKASEGEASGVEPKYQNMRTVVRRMHRKAATREAKAAAASGTGGKRAIEEGEVSDGAASAASSSVSKLARKAQNFEIR